MVGVWPLIGLGLVVGLMAMGRAPGWYRVLTCAVLLATPATVGWRRLPVHSLGVGAVERLEVEAPGGETFTVTDAADLRAFEQFAARGSLGTMSKSGYGARVRVWRRGEGTHYYNHGNCLGPMQGGFVQSVFVPARPGFYGWFEDLLARNGHKKR